MIIFVIFQILQYQTWKCSPFSTFERRRGSCLQSSPGNFLPPLILQTCSYLCTCQCALMYLCTCEPFKPSAPSWPRQSFWLLSSWRCPTSPPLETTGGWKSILKEQFFNVFSREIVVMRSDSGKKWSLHTNRSAFLSYPFILRMVHLQKYDFERQQHL